MGYVFVDMTGGKCLDNIVKIMKGNQGPKTKS